MSAAPHFYSGASAPGSSRELLHAWSKAGELYALVDAFFEMPFPLEKARLDLKDTDPLFFEQIAWEKVTYEPAAIVKLTPEALDWFLNSLSTERWGVFLASMASPRELALHFQKFAIAKGPDSNPYFLRFHDASVLDVLLQTWDAREKATFFGPVTAFALPDLDSVDVTIEMNPLASGGLAAQTREPRVSLRPQKPEDCLVSLRASQLKLCAEAIDRDLIKVIYWHLRNHHSRPVQFLDRANLEARLRVAVVSARRYGLATISDLAGYAALMFELAPNFDQHPSFKRVLEDPLLPSDTKMRRLAHVISDQEWSQAASLYDRQFWLRALKRSSRVD